MKILLARTAGFCMGVRRATEIAINAVRAGKHPVATLGPLIHNPQAIRLLESRGIHAMPENRVPDTGALIIRAHGITPSQQADLQGRGLEIIDATCPHVLASRKRILNACSLNHEIVLVGDNNHPEVKGLAGHATTGVHIISTTAEAEDITPSGPVEILAQTTFSKELYDQIVSIIRNRFPDAIIHDSICSATEMRQNETRVLASQADALVVVGGRHSANTRRLAEIGRQAGKPTFHVETATELQPEEFAGAGTVAITAGASTPGWLTQQVIDRIEDFGKHTFGGRMRNLLRIAARARLTTAIGAGALCHAINRLMNAGPTPWGILGMVTAFVFTAYTLNRREPAANTADIPVPVDRFYQDHRPGLLCVAALAFGFNLVMALHLGWPTLGLILAAHVAAILYTVPILPSSFPRRRLKDLPASKDLLVAAAWAVVLVGIISIHADSSLNWKRVLGTAGIVFLMTFAKTVMLDLRDIEGDHLIGIETLPILIGRNRAIMLIYCVHWCLYALTFGLGLSGLGGPFALVFSLVPLYGVGALYLLVRSRFRGEVHCQLVIDFQLVCAGVISIIWGLVQ